MSLSKETALRAYAKMMNNLDASHIEPFLADDFVYVSQAVFESISSKPDFLEYIYPKLETIRRADAPVFAEMGRIGAYGEIQTCVITAQYDRSNLVAVVLASVDGEHLTQLTVCTVAPPPEQAERSGDYPT